MHIAKVRLMSKVLFMPTELIVALPETVDEQKKKVVWLLHGANGDCHTWLQSKYFQQAMEGRGAIAVLPSALNSDYGNYPAFGTGYQFADFFFDELMPFVYANFPASSAPEDNYIIGASMGGYGAMALGLLHPERFEGIGAFGSSLRRSEFLAPYQEGSSEAFRKAALENPTAFPTEYGPPSLGIKLKEVNVITKYPTIQGFLDSFECMWRRLPEVAKAGILPRLYVACGTEDLFFPTTQDFQAMAKELGITDAAFHFAEGTGHNEEFFDQQLGASLDWFGL